MPQPPTPPAQPQKVRIALKNEQATKRLARLLAGHLRPGQVILLDGELGSGKTTFVRAVIRAITGQMTEVPSPTFTLIQRYDETVPPIVHADLYRLSGPGETGELGLEDAMTDAALMVEWPGRLPDLLTADALEIRFELGHTPQERLVTLNAASDWPAFFADLKKHFKQMTLQEPKA